MKNSILLFFLFSCLLGGHAQLSPTLILDESNATEYAPAISPDGNTLVYQTNLNGEWRLHVAYREASGWTRAGALFGKLAEGAYLGGPSFSADGATLVFFSDMASEPGSLDLYSVSFEPDTRTWGDPSPYPAPINTPDYEGFPSIGPEGKTLYFVRERELPSGPEEADTLSSELVIEDLQSRDCYLLYMATRREDGTWTEPVPLPDHLNDGCVGYPRIMPDGHTLVFSRFNEKSLHDLYWTSFQNGSWSEPVLLKDLASEGDDKMLSLSFNGTSASFSRSNAEGGYTGEDRLYFLEGNTLQAFAGRVALQVTLQDPENQALRGKIVTRSAEGDSLQTIEILGTSLFTLQAGRSYLLTISAPGHEFKSFPIDLTNAAGPDTLIYDMVLRPLKKEVLIVLDNLTFDYNSADISQSAASVIEVATGFLLENEHITIEIEAHTDDIGSASFNLDLSNRRAEAVVAALVANGISPDRLISKGWGEERPIADNLTEEGRAQNRRVVFRILEE